MATPSPPTSNSTDALVKVQNTAYTHTPKTIKVQQSVSQCLQDNTQSTPLSETASVVRGDTRKPTKEITHPYIKEEISKFLLCPIRDLIGWALESCVDQPAPEHEGREPTWRLKECLEMKEFSSVCDNHDVKEHLKAYCKGREENDRYAPFVKMCNQIFRLVEKIQVAGIRAVDEVNKPLLVCTKETNVASGTRGVIRKPDLSFVTLATAQKIFEPLLKDCPAELIWEKCAIELASGKKTPDNKEVDLPTAVDTVPSTPPAQGTFSSNNASSSKGAKQSRKVGHESPPPVQSLLRKLDWVQPSLKLLSAVEVKRRMKELTFVDCAPGGLEAEPDMEFEEADQQDEECEETEEDWFSTKTTDATSSALQTTTSANNRKRAHPNDQTAPRKKAKYTGVNEDMVQAAMYGVQLLCAGNAAHRAICLLVRDDLVSVWVYDRQGAIKSESINFVKNLDYLVVLLFAFQRFTSANWGQLLEFSYHKPAEGSSTSGWSLTLPAGEANKDEMVLELQQPKTGRTTYGIIGRHTRVLDVETNGLKEVVLKLSSVGAGRTPEDQLIRRARELVPDSVRHLPTVHRSHRFSETRTYELRKALKAKFRKPHSEDTNIEPSLEGTSAKPILKDKNMEAGSRILTALVLNKLEPIQSLQGQDLLCAFLDCFKCHYELYKQGILHRDISVNNLMFERNEKGRIVGVLNDFDMAVDLNVTTGPTGMERTGTPPYMALDLLKEHQGSVKHLYRHDAESFLWVLLDLTSSYSNGVRRPRFLMKDWFQVGSYKTMHEKKLAMLDDLTEHTKFTMAIEDNNLRQVVKHLLLEQQEQELDRKIAKLRAAKRSAQSNKGSGTEGKDVKNRGEHFENQWDETENEDNGTGIEGREMTGEAESNTTPPKFGEDKEAEGVYNTFYRILKSGICHPATAQRT